MSASEKAQFKDNGWFVGVTPRRNPEMVVAVLLQEGEHGFFAARAASQVIKAYVEKQRTRETLVAKANGGTAPSGKAEVAAVWHQADSNGAAAPENKMQAGHFNIDASGKTKPVSAAPGVVEEKSTASSRDLQGTESHPEMAEPEAAPAAEPAQPSLQGDSDAPVTAPVPAAIQKKPSSKPLKPAQPPGQPATEPAAAPAAAIVPERQP